MDNMDKLNGGYWETRGERRSRKRTNFFIEETKSPPKSSKKRTIEDIEKNEGSESTSPPHKRSKVAHKEEPDSRENDDYDDQNTDPNIQSCNSLAYEPVSKIVVTQPDLASDTNNNELEPAINTTYNNDIPQYSIMEQSSMNNANSDAQAGALIQTQASTSSLAVPSLDKEFDSPVKEIKFSFPSEVSEATQPTDQPSLDAAVSTQTDGNSGLTNSANSASNTVQQSLMTSANSVVNNIDNHPSEASKADAAPIVSHEDSSDILLINNNGVSAEPESTATLERKKSRVIEDNNSPPEAMEIENESQIIDEIAEANAKEVVTIHSNQLASLQDVSKSRDNLGSDLKSDRSEPKSSVKEEDISVVSVKEIDLRGSNPKIVPTNEDKSKSKTKKKKSGKVRQALLSLVKNNYSAKDYSKFKEISKKLTIGGEREYCAGLVSVLRSNEKIMNEYIGYLPPKYQQMCIEAAHAMEQSDESEVHELSQDMVDNVDRPATRSTTGPLVFGLQKQIMENPEIANEVLPAWRGDFVADEDDYGLTQDSAGLDAPRADNWSTPTSKKQKEKKLSALQKLKEDKENAKNKPKVVPKATTKPTKYVMPKFGEEERFKKKSNKINAGGYNIDGGYEDSDESDQDLEDTVPDDEKDQEIDYTLPAYGPEFIEDDFIYGYQEKNPEKGGAGRAPKSPTKKTSSGSKNGSSPVREPRHGHSTGNTNVTPTKSSSNLSNTNARANNSNNYGHSGSNNTTPTKSPSIVNTRPSNNSNNTHMGYSNLMPAVPVQTTLERSFFPSTARSNSGGANDLAQRLQPANINEGNNNNTNNVVHLESSPLGKNNNTNQPQAPTSPVTPVQYTGPKIKILFTIPALKIKSIIAFPTEDNNGVPMTMAQLKEHISKLNSVEVTALKLGDYQIGNNNDAVRDLLDGKEEITVEIKDIKKSLADVYKEKCQSEGIPVNELLTTKLVALKPSNLQLNGQGVVRVRDLEVLSTSIDLNVVEYLNLNSNALGMPYFADLERMLVRQNKSLKSLNLSNCSLTDPNMFQVLTSLNSLQELNISGNTMSDNIGVQLMTVLPNLANLTNLDLSRCNVGPSTMKALEDSRFCDNGIYPQNKGLAVISASFNRLQSIGVNHLTAALCQRTTTSLLTLKLQQVEISENDQNHCAKSLHKLMALKTARLADLDLSGNIFTSKLRWIGQGINDSIHLHTIRLNKCGLNSESLTDITEVLQFSQSLTCLELSDNILGKSGADLISQVLLKPHKLQQLKLNNCGLTSVGLLIVLRSCHGQNLHLNITRLELENNCDVEFSRLKYGDRNLTDAFSKLNAKLMFLELSRNSINDEDVRNALKQSWEEIHGKEQLSITMSHVSLRFMKIQRKN